MAFVPASSIAPATVTVAGTVAVSNFPATQPVSGTVAVTGPLTNAELRAADVEVSQGAGGLAWAVVQATVPWLVDASGFTVPVSVTGQPIQVDASGTTVPISAASLPLPAGAATEDTLVEVKRAGNDVALTAILQRETMETG